MPALPFSKRPRAPVRALAALLLAWCVLLASVFSGRVCAPCLAADGLASWCGAATCSLDAAPVAEAGPVADAHHCDDQPGGELPDAVRRQAPRVVAVMPAALFTSAPPYIPAQRAIDPARLPCPPPPDLLRGPPRAGPRTAAERCASLQVHHC